jgi:hypothetical protein
MSDPRQHPHQDQRQRRPNRPQARRRPTILAATLTVAVAAAVAAVMTISPQAHAAPRPATTTRPAAGTARFLGRWNYRTPQPATGLNIATVRGTGFSENFPQVGWIDFTSGRDGEVTGRTDQGCTWRFALKSGRLQLASPGQACFNKVIGSKYQMNRWTVSVTGGREQEYIQATSFLPSGTYGFTLARGARTKVTKNTGAGGYAGHWTFNPPNESTGVNIETLVDANGQASRQPVSGKLAITRTARNKISVRTANGCHWNLNVAGNTAELARPQTCHLRGGATQTYSFWAMAVGGAHQYAVLSGTNLSAGKRTEFSLATGRLTRR